MDWLLIAELFNAVSQMEEHHGWDMSCGETAAFVKPLYESITAHGFPKDRAAWDAMIELAQRETWGDDHTCAPMTNAEIWEFVCALSDSYTVRIPNAGVFQAAVYIRDALGAGKYPTSENSEKDSRDA